MAQFDKGTLNIVKRLQSARLSLLSKQPFYALLLMNMKFALDITCQTAYTDGTRIAFNPDFINSLSDSELEFVLMHEVLHVALGHTFRVQADYDLEAYDLACDIVVNSNILKSFDMDLKKITLKEYGEAIHVAPDGKEGYEYTVEQVYIQLLKTLKKNKNKDDSDSVNDVDESQDDSEEDAEIDDEDEDKDDSEEDEGHDGDGDGAGNGNGKGCGKGSGKGNGKGNGKGGSASGGGTEGDLESLIASIKAENAEKAATALIKETMLKESDENSVIKETEFDDHSFWKGDDELNSQRDVWYSRMVEATEMISTLDGGKSRGTIPQAAERLIEELKKPILDWRTILNDFIQEEICDYSFAPPDKRMEDCPFFLPDFNEKDEKVKDILFMIDTSGSMSDDEISQCYSEIYNAIIQFNGKLQGMLGFFDAVVVEPTPFEDEEEFKIIRPKGGGGTSFHIIFDYVREKMIENPPASIIILTDGYAPFPNEDDAEGIPVLWIINNNEVNPPWGKVARLIEEHNN